MQKANSSGTAMAAITTTGHRGMESMEGLDGGSDTALNLGQRLN
jgi:hypothetical protein